MILTRLVGASVSTVPPRDSPMHVAFSRNAGFGRRRPYLVGVVAVHRLSLGLREQLQEEDKEEGEGVVRTTRRSMSLH